MCIFVSILFASFLCTQESKRVNKWTKFVPELFEQISESFEVFGQVFLPKVLQLVVTRVPCMDVVVQMIRFKQCSVLHRFDRHLCRHREQLFCCIGQVLCYLWILQKGEYVPFFACGSCIVEHEVIVMFIRQIHHGIL